MVDFFKNVDWIFICQLIAGLFALISIFNGFTQFRNSNRHKLKLDLEILKHLESESHYYELVKKSVYKNIESIYSDKVIIHRRWHLVGGLLSFIAFSIWAYSIYLNKGVTLGFIIVILYSTNGIMFIIDSFRTKSFTDSIFDEVINLFKKSTNANN